MFVVGDEFRTNPESNTPGGSTVTVCYADGQELVYPRIKKTDAYIRTVLAKSGKIIDSIYVDSTLVYSRKTNL